MPESAFGGERERRQSEAILEIDVLWITAGLGCDGDTIAMTAAKQPSIEDIILGAIPWIPKVRLHNPFLTYDNGEEFMRHFHLAAEGKLSPFILIIEGSIPDETNKKDGYWASFGTNQKTGEPILTCDWIDRLAPKAWAVIAAGTCATYGGIHAMEGNPTGCMGLADYLGWKWKSRASIPARTIDCNEHRGDGGGRSRTPRLCANPGCALAARAFVRRREGSSRFLL
jgi:hydrogenase small subunit